MFRVEFFIIFYSTIVSLPSSSYSQIGTFIKTDHTFERIVQNDTLTRLDAFSTHTPDYISVIGTLLDMLIKDNSSVKAQHLNKFNLGLHQFYLSLAYELYYKRTAFENPKLHFNDPVRMPNATAIGKPDLWFHGVQVYGFPGFKKWNQRLEGEPGDPYLQFCKTLRTFTSDAMIFTGYFTLTQKDHFFVYYTRNNTLKNTLTKWRTNQGTIVPKRFEESLHFAQETLSHTYESNWKKYPIVNSTLHKKLVPVIEQIWLPKLVSLMYDKLHPNSVRDNGIFAATYRRKVIECLVESAKHYVRLTSPSDTFESSSLKFTTKSRHGITYVRKYERLKIEGVLNFDQYHASGITPEDFSANTSSSVVSDTVTFWYSSDKNNTFGSFSIVDENSPDAVFDKKYSIASMNVTCIYDVTDEKPLKIARKKDAFENGSGFLISFDLVDFDREFEFVVQHIGDDMARTIGKLLDTEKAIFEQEFE